MKKLAAILAIVLTIVSLTIPAMAEDKELVVYHSATDDQMAAVVAAFNEVYPDIHVTTYRATGEQLAATCSMELMANNPQFDVILAGTDITMPLKEKYDPFLEWTPDNVANIKEELFETDGQAYPFGCGFYVIIYNTKLISEEEAPKSFKDLTDEKYMNQIIMADPASSGSIYNMIWFMTRCLDQEEYGWDYFAKLGKLNTMLISSHGTLGETVAIGERAVGIQVVSTAMTSYDRGDPIAIVYPEEGCAGDLVVSVIQKNTEHLDAAKTFLNFCYSEEGQRVVGKNAWPPILKQLDGFVFSDGTNPADVTVYGSDKVWIANEKPQILEQFQEAFGK